MYLCVRDMDLAFVYDFDFQTDPTAWYVFHHFIIYFSSKKFEDTKEVVKIRKSKKNSQHNGQKKKNKRTNNDLQNIYINCLFPVLRTLPGKNNISLIIVMFFSSGVP